jgi:hypothetical protein
MNCHEIMSTDLQRIGPNQTAEEAAKMMKSRKRGWLVVCLEDERALGVITDGDIAQRVVVEGRSPNRTSELQPLRRWRSGLLGHDHSVPSRYNAGPALAARGWFGRVRRCDLANAQVTVCGRPSPSTPCGACLAEAWGLSWGDALGPASPLGRSSLRLCL